MSRVTRHFTAREFNQDIAGAKRASRDGPVIITERGRPAQVLLSFDEYLRLSGATPSLTDLSSWPGTEDINLDIPPRAIEPPRAIDVD